MRSFNKPSLSLVRGGEKGEEGLGLGDKMKICTPPLKKYLAV